MTDSTVSIGSGSHHVVALHGWFGSARGWGSLPDYLDRRATRPRSRSSSESASIEEFLGQG
jgi:hypothetical protein